MRGMTSGRFVSNHMFDSEFPEDEEQDIDIFDALEVATTTPAARGSSLLDAFAEDEPEEESGDDEGTVIATLDFNSAEDGGEVLDSISLEDDIGLEDEDDVDPFEELGAVRPVAAVHHSVSSIDDALAAFMEDEEDEIADEGPVEAEQDEIVETEEETINTEEPEVDEREVKIKEVIRPKAEPEELYRFLLEGVWVDDVLDPAEVALMARKRRELEITFETHLRLLKEILHE